MVARIAWPLLDTEAFVTGPTKGTRSVSVDTETYDMVTGQVLVLSAELHRRLPVSSVVRAALMVAEQHRDEFVEVLKGVVGS